MSTSMDGDEGDMSIEHDRCKNQNGVLPLPQGVWEEEDPTKENEELGSDFNDKMDATLNSVELADKHFPEDCYSFVALNNPFESPEKRKMFLLGLLPFTFQVTLLLLLVISTMNQKLGTVGESDNPWEERDGFMGDLAQYIPAKANLIVRFAQAISLAAYVIFPEATVYDLVNALRLFPRSSGAEDKDQIACMRFSCILRGMQSILAVFSILPLVLFSQTALDIILNFTAVNFISHLDEILFSCAKIGDLGPIYKAGAKEVATAKIPPCALQAPRHVYHRMVVLTISAIFSVVTVFVMASQYSNQVWYSRILRVQFQDDPQLDRYSGCYEINDQKQYLGRYAYNSLVQAKHNSSFGYCRGDRQWILFQGNDDSVHPCDARDDNLELARSSKTDAFDISTIFDEPWVTSSNTPISLYFFDGDDEEEIRTHCDSRIGDGVCDSFFNEPGFQFDDGDCCSATCTSTKCGRGGLTTVFGSKASGIGYSSCDDPRMVNVTIRLNSISSSRDPEFVGLYPVLNGISDNVTEWMAETPVNPYFALDCNEKNVLTVYIEQSMVGNLEHVQVEDGANCVLVVRSTTANVDWRTDDPIWYVNYTLFYRGYRGGNDIIMLNEQNDDDHRERKDIEIFTEQSNRADTIPFKLLPNCYLGELKDHVDIATSYTASGPENEAIKWLASKDEDNSECDNEFLLERFALATIFFALDGEDIWAYENGQCTWPSIVCDKGQVTQINLSLKLLQGTIPSEILLLTNLQQLKLNGNLITAIPTEIGRMTHLRNLDLNDNYIRFIPTEIGLLPNLEKLDLKYNLITSIPTQIGTTTLLKDLDLAGNLIVSAPSEIGLLTNLKKLRLDYNTIASIPTEFGLMKNLEDLGMSSNQLMSIPSEISLLQKLYDLSLSNNDVESIPTEIGMMTNLKDLDLLGNRITFIPSEIGLLTNLDSLTFDLDAISSLPSEVGLMTNLELFSFYVENNQHTYIPSEIGRMTSSKNLDFSRNKISSIPSEIAMMKNLETLDFDYNTIAFIPSEIGLMTDLQELHLNANQITSIPSEIGLMTGLKDLSIAFNRISSLPSEIALLTNLETLDVSNNDIVSIPSGIESMQNLQLLLEDDTTSCGIDIDVALSGCSLIWSDFDNNCEGSLRTVSFQYNGGDCSQSDNLQPRARFNCKDSNGGPPTAEGSESYIEAVSTTSNDLYFAGLVSVGEIFTLNANKTFDKLSAVTINVFDSQGWKLLQTTSMIVSCPQNPLFVFDRFGSHQIYGWEELGGRLVNTDLPQNRTIVLDFALRAPVPVRLETMTFIFGDLLPFDYTSQVAGKVLEPGTVLELPQFTAEQPLFIDGMCIRKTFFAIIGGESLDGTRLCTKSLFFECSPCDQSNDFPTMEPTTIVP